MCVLSTGLDSLCRCHVSGEFSHDSLLPIMHPQQLDLGDEVSSWGLILSSPKPPLCGTFFSFNDQANKCENTTWSGVWSSRGTICHGLVRDVFPPITYPRTHNCNSKKGLSQIFFWVRTVLFYFIFFFFKKWKHKVIIWIFGSGEPATSFPGTSAQWNVSSLLRNKEKKVSFMVWKYKALSFLPWCLSQITRVFSH